MACHFFHTCSPQSSHHVVLPVFHATFSSFSIFIVAFASLLYYSVLILTVQLNGTFGPKQPRSLCSYIVDCRENAYYFLCIFGPQNLSVFGFAGLAAL